MFVWLFCSLMPECPLLQDIEVRGSHIQGNNACFAALLFDTKDTSVLSEYHMEELWGEG